MKFFTKSTAAQTTAVATTNAVKAARKVEMAKNVLAIYGGVRLVADVVNAVRVAKLIKSGQIVQGDDGMWYYTTPEDEEGGVVEEEEAQ
jgi:hypothetical protein